MDTIRPSRDLPQMLFGILLILTLLGSALWILHPFLLSVVWAGVIVIATWPLLLQLENRLGKHRKLAIMLMMLTLVAIFLLPMILSAGMLSLFLEKTMQWLLHLDTSRLPPLDFLTRIPVFGKHLHDEWLSLIRQSSAHFLTTLKPWIMKSITVLMQELTHFGGLFLNGALTLLACLVFYIHGERIATGLRWFAWRIALERGDHAILLAGQTVRAVAMGVVVTAVIQSAFAGIGLAVCGIPSTSLLTGIIFVLCLMQLGPIIIMLPAVIWLFSQGQHWSGTLLLIWAVIAGSIDNILKPLFINRGTETSLLLIMSGVIGGMLAFGIIGLMVGPVLLAVSWKLLSTWVSETRYPPFVMTKEKS